MKIALEGAINKCSDSVCNDWRDKVIQELEDIATFHNPMDFDCRGREFELEQALVDYDTAGIASCDIVLVLAERPSWGTAMGLQMAWAMHKHTVVIHSSGNPSPWLRNRADVIMITLDEAIEYIRDYIEANEGN